jgi:CBS-domain-containing membrane protein
MGITTEMQRSKRHQDDDLESKRMLQNGRKRLQSAHVGDYMTSSISVVSPKATLGEALHLFTAMNITVLAVYDGKSYVGLIERSSVKENKVVGRNLHTFHHVRVREVMNTTNEPCSPQELVCEAWERMRRSGQMYSPVLDTQGKLAGVLSLQQ